MVTMQVIHNLPNVGGHFVSCGLLCRKAFSVGHVLFPFEGCACRARQRNAFSISLFSTW
jgi:hypothetical protein